MQGALDLDNFKLGWRCIGIGSVIGALGTIG